MTDLPEGGPERRAAITAAISSQTGIDEPMIERLVKTFYARIQVHPVLGPIFAAKIENWDEHIDKLCAFWSSVALMTGRYHGHPMRAHLRLPIAATHFDQWLALFEATAREVCPPQAAEHFLDRARRIADSFEMGLATTRGEIFSPRHSRAVTRAS
ncbi:group III truncated hemoglobin [Bradyrhizobium sp. 2TAF24]|uniref:group III truncated hemoglobin n=1 Tax=Bradyrhizobium sp. 2TAF24 TaxID=3233011 RepID=UPI003F92EC9A